jgi:translocation and assembly module TamB
VNGTLQGGTADLAATGTAPLGLANAFIEPRALAGTAAFDLRLSGPLALSSVSGTVGISGGRLSDPGLGEALNGITGTIGLGGGSAQVNLSGGLLAGGTVAVTGPVGLSAPFPANLAVTGTDLVIRDPALYEARASARVTVSGPLAGGAVIGGVVDVAEVEVRVPSSGIGALGDLPDVRHVDPSRPVRLTLDRAGLAVSGGPSGGAAASGGGGGGFPLDLLVNAPARVFIRGRGLDAELGGTLQLGGTTAAVVPAGQFSLLRGRLDLLGQRFDLTEGSASLQGAFDPYLRLVATTQARTGTTISIIVEGPASEPEVRFESTPQLPEDEVLAQLLFGVDIDSITPFQAVQLAAAVATLAGRGGGFLDDIRAGAGLADFDITTDAEGNAALRLGRYLSDNVYTDVQVSGEETEATINLDLTPNLTLRAGVTSTGETALGIEFGRDF